MSCFIAGKTNLVEEGEHLLGNKDWRLLGCKFDQEARPQPLSTIASAFDHLVDVMNRLDDDGQQEVKVSLVHMFSTGDIETLSMLIPSLKIWTTVREVDTQVKEPNELPLDNTDAAKCRLHNLFGLLTKALSHRAPLSLGAYPVVKVGWQLGQAY